MGRHKPQPGVRDSEGRKIPKKYLKGLSKKKRGEMKKEIKDFRDKPDNYSPAYKPWKADKGVKPKKKSKATKAYHRMFGKKHEDESLFGRIFLESDQRLRDLERAYHASPGDREAVEAYARALLRAGRADDAERVELGYHADQLYDRVHKTWKKSARREKFLGRLRGSIERSGGDVFRSHYQRGYHLGAGVPRAAFDDYGDLKLTAEELRKAAEKYGGHEAVSRAIHPGRHKNRADHLRTLAAAHGVHGTNPHDPYKRAYSGYFTSITAFSGKQIPRAEIRRRIANTQRGAQQYYDRVSTSYSQGSPGHEDQHTMSFRFTDDSPHTWDHGQPTEHRYPPGHGPEDQQEWAMAEDEARDAKWDITHKDLSRGKMLLVKRSTGERRLLRPTQAAMMRSRIAQIERQWGDGVGPKRRFPNHHKHIDAVLEPFFGKK